jgi:very-short-patch-repair endonuclease
MLWPHQRLIVEVDGRVKYTADELWREKRRQERLERLGYRVVRVMWSDVVHDWPATLRRILDALGRPAGKAGGWRTTLHPGNIPLGVFRSD